MWKMEEKKKNKKNSLARLPGSNKHCDTHWTPAAILLPLFLSLSLSDYCVIRESAKILWLDNSCKSCSKLNYILTIEDSKKKTKQTERRRGFQQRHTHNDISTREDFSLVFWNNNKNRRRRTSKAKHNETVSNWY